MSVAGNEFCCLEQASPSLNVGTEDAGVADNPWKGPRETETNGATLYSIHRFRAQRWDKGKRGQASVKVDLCLGSRALGAPVEPARVESQVKVTLKPPTKFF